MSKVTPRPEQVAALTRGQSLPLPPLPETTLHLVADTLLRAWSDIAAAHAQILRQGSETEVNSLLESRLIALRDEDTCWEMLVHGVSRDRSVISFDGSHIAKSPDLSIHLTNHRFDFPLLVECKLIDHRRRKTVQLYCRDGLMRFIAGEYAWMSAEAFMVAYVRDGSSIAGTLHPHLVADGSCATLDLPLPRTSSADLACSKHDRLFSYLPPAGAPGPIVLWHLWLR